jgi:hypothetical protein
MNANTAMLINDAIDQAVRCGESVEAIEAQVKRAFDTAARTYRPDNVEAEYRVTVTLDAPSGIPAAAAEWQGWGASYLRAYLETKMPAGSPYTIGVVERA